MCDTCRDFCRSHSDLEIPCGRPGCENSWMHKTGAQLQGALAGRTQVPMRLCEECSRGGFISSLQEPGQELPEGAERMPCVVSGCEGSWVWFPGQKLRDEEDTKGQAVGKMCLSCRQERGFDENVAAEAASNAAEVASEAVSESAEDKAPEDKAAVTEDAESAPCAAEASTNSSPNPEEPGTDSGESAS